MGLFSRKEKAPKTTASKPSISTSEVSINSGASSLKSPPGNTRGAFNRFSGSSANNHNSPTAMAAQIPKVDLPRPPDPQLDPAGYLRSLPAVRERSKIVTDKALQNQLTHFNVDMSKFPDVVSFVAQIIKVRSSQSSRQRFPCDLVLTSADSGTTMLPSTAFPATAGTSTSVSAAVIESPTFCRLSTM